MWAARAGGGKQAAWPHSTQPTPRPLAPQWTYSPRARPQVGLQAPSPARLPGCAATPSALLGPRWAAAQRRVSVLHDGQATDLAVSLCLGINRRPRLPQHRPQSLLSSRRCVSSARRTATPRRRRSCTAGTSPSARPSCPGVPGRPPCAREASPQWTSGGVCAARSRVHAQDPSEAQEAPRGTVTTG